MIRINLLSEGRRAVTRKEPAWQGFKSGATDVASILLMVLLGAGLLVAGGSYFFLRRDVQAMRLEIADAQQEVDELAPFIEEVENFKARKAELENKVAIINNLKANQPGPVRIMDYVSRALPALLWLDRMEVQPATISVSGQAFNTNAVANFIENLDKVPEFQEPILKDTSQRGQVYSFVVEFGYSFASAAPLLDQEEVAASS